MRNKNLENGVIKSEPKQWTEDEIQRMMDLKKEGLSFSQIGEILKRTQESCRRKYQRQKIELDKYNVRHRNKKYELNRQFVAKIKPKTILDAFSGGVSWYKTNTNLEVLDNDIKIKGADFNLDAIDFLHMNRKKKFDIVDLDPFGSAFDCFDYALQIAQKGIIITFGEVCGRRFNRMDFVEYRYGIEYLKDFTTTTLSQYVEKRGLIFRKKLTPIIKAKMTNISRVYFEIEHFDYGKSGCKYFPSLQTKLL